RGRDRLVTQRTLVDPGVDLTGFDLGALALGRALGTTRTAGRADLVGSALRSGAPIRACPGLAAHGTARASRALPGLATGAGGAGPGRLDTHARLTRLARGAAGAAVGRAAARKSGTTGTVDRQGRAAYGPNAAENDEERRLSAALFERKIRRGPTLP